MLCNQYETIHALVPSVRPMHRTTSTVASRLTNELLRDTVVVRPAPPWTTCTGLSFVVEALVVLVGMSAKIGGGQAPQDAEAGITHTYRGVGRRTVLHTDSSARQHGVA